MSGSSRFFNRPRGRFFGVKDEQRRINAGMEDYQQVYGTEVLWFFFTPGESTYDDIYDEGFVEGGKSYDGPHRIPVMSAVPTQGAETPQDNGYATYDQVTLRMSYEQVRRAGLSHDLVLEREERQLDRFVYRNRVFDVVSIQTSGHFEQTSADTVLQIQGMQLRKDELVDAVAFQKWSG